MATRSSQRGPVDAFEPRTGLWTLGLPLRAPRSTWLATLALACFYCATMARDLSLYDSGELALAAVQLGLAHPPGQPVHTLIGFVFSHLPGVPALIGVNLVSALPAALALIPATSLSDRLADQAHAAVRPWLLALFALHPVLWEPATRVEVYSLAALSCGWSIAAVAAGSGRMFAIGLALGAAASVNPVIALATAVTLVPAITRRLIRTRSFGLPLLAGGLLGLATYLYVPLVAARSGVMIWGAPRDLESYLRYFLLRDYAHNQGISFTLWFAHASEWLAHAFAGGLAPLVVLGCIGHVCYARRSLGRAAMPALFLLLLGVIAANVVFYVEIPDYNGYLATAVWALAAGAVACCTHAARTRPLQVIGAAAALLAMASTLAASPQPWERTRQHDRLARVLAERVLAEAKPNAIVIAESDAIAGALFYLQGAERARTDVVVLAYGLTGSRWHWEQLLAQHPTLATFALRGPNARAGRVQRMLAANPERAVLVERWATGNELALSMCAGGLFLRTGAACADGATQDPAVARLLAEQLAELGDGSPSAAGAIAQISYLLGEALWRLGDARAGYELLLAGVPTALRPKRPADASLANAPAPPPSAASPRFARDVALGDPGRNLFLAGAIAGAAGDRELARASLAAAAASGLPEARAIVSASER